MMFIEKTGQEQIKTDQTFSQISMLDFEATMKLSKSNVLINHVTASQMAGGMSSARYPPTMY